MAPPSYLPLRVGSCDDLAQTRAGLSVESAVPTEAVAASVVGGSIVSLSRGILTEEVSALREGLELSWQLDAAPARAVEVAIRFPNAHMRTAPRGVEISSPDGQGRYVLGPAAWVDAQGHSTAVPAVLSGELVHYAIPLGLLRSSTYPARLDPTLSALADVDDAGGTGTPVIGFDGTNYLVVWAVSTPPAIYAARVSPAGSVLDTPPLVVGQSSGPGAPVGATFNGSNYLVSWLAQDGLQAVRVSPAGVMLDAAPLMVTAAPGCGIDCAATGAAGSQWLIALGECMNALFGVRVDANGNVLDPDGGFAFATTPPSPATGVENVSVASNGSDYFVGWTRDTFTNTSAAQFQRLTLQGTEIDVAYRTLSDEAGSLFTGYVPGGDYWLGWIHSGPTFSMTSIPDDGGAPEVQWPVDLDSHGVFDGVNFVIVNLNGQLIRVSPDAGMLGSALTFTGLGASPSIAAGPVGQSLIAYVDGTSAVVYQLYDENPAPLGTPCDVSSDCLSGFCSDAVCCASACGGGVPTDCMACSTSAGGSQDGTCTAVQAGQVCHSPIAGCDTSQYCDGSSLTCPPDGAQDAGTLCAVATACSAAAYCDGLGPQCPAAVVFDAGTPCLLEDTCVTQAVCNDDICVPTEFLVCLPGTQCQQAWPCEEGEGCTTSVLPDGTPCDAGNPCTVGDSCLNGICEEGPSCPAATPCHVGSCSGADGVACVYSAVADGTACSTGDPCQTMQVCISGVCSAGGSPCVAQAECQAVSCSGDASCAFTQLPDGSGCDGGHCWVGACVAAATGTDAGHADAGMADAGSSDAGAVDAGLGFLWAENGHLGPPANIGCGCAAAEATWVPLLVVSLLVVRRRPRRAGRQ
jgi:MYXO-CTERM domain-containing protein